MLNINALLGLLLASLFSCLLGEIEARLDAKIINERFGKIASINHITGGLFRLILIVPIILFYKDIYYTLLLCSLVGIVYYIYFEIRLNQLRDSPILYVGKTSSMDKFIRKTFKKNTEIKLFICKLLVFILSCSGSIIYGSRI